MIDIHKECNQGVFAELIGVTQQAVSKLIKKGTLKSDDTLGGWILDYCENLRHQAAGRSGDDQAQLTKARTRDALASSKLKEVQLLEACGRLVNIEEVEPMLNNWAIIARSEVSSAVGKIIADIQGQHDIVIDYQIIENHMNSAYTMIGNHPAKPNQDTKNELSEVD